MLLYVGIDPGLHGAIAVAGASPIVHDMPILNSGIAVHALHDLLVDIHENPGEIVKIYIEKQQAMSGQGVSSTFKIGANYGALLATVALMKIPYEIVTPAVWKKAMGLTSDKEVSREKALQLFPACAQDLQRKKDEGRAEALLLAEYGRRRNAQYGINTTQ